MTIRPGITQRPVAPVQDASSKQQTKQKYKPNPQQTGLPSHSALPIRGKTNKQKLSTNLTLYKAYTNHWTNFQFSSVTQLCPTLCDPMNHSTSGLPVHHQLPEFTQTHAHPVSDSIQPSHPLLCPFPPAPNPSQHQGLFQ